MAVVIRQEKMVGDRGDIQMGGELFVSRVLELRRESMRGRGGSASTSPEETRRD